MNRTLPLLLLCSLLLHLNAAAQSAASVDDIANLGAVIRDIWAMEPDDIRVAPKELLAGVDSQVADVYVYADGVLITASHARSSGGPTSLGRALYEARLFAGDRAAGSTELVIFLGRGLAMVPLENFWTSTWVRKYHGGQVGFTAIGEGDAFLRWLSPIETVAINQSGDLERLRNRLDLPEARSIEIIGGEQLWVPLSREKQARLLERGNTPVAVASITREQLENAAVLAEGWLRSNINERGRLLYRFHPANCSEDPANNMIRQWMASLVLTEILAERPEDDELNALVSRNLRYNLERFYKTDQLFGYIEYGGKAKLGAAAIAALTLSKAPNPEKWQAELNGLDRTISHLWKNDGSFRTFFFPQERNDNQNFYPGEALLYWAHKYTVTKNEFLYKRMLKSIDYYQAWHEENKNPAFVPWHTMAYAELWKVQPDEQLVAYIFKMNDWLIGMQQNQFQLAYQDMAGRFYAPGKGYGPPHVSSTAVYLEGLGAALEIAQHLGDEERTERYTSALVDGLRNLLQLQFEDPAELYYLPLVCREKAYGAFRTAAYDSTIRCDNVQHSLQAIRTALRVLDF